MVSESSAVCRAVWAPGSVACYFWSGVHKSRASLHRGWRPFCSCSFCIVAALHMDVKALATCRLQEEFDEGTLSYRFRCGNHLATTLLLCIAFVSAWFDASLAVQIQQGVWQEWVDSRRQAARPRRRASLLHHVSSVCCWAL